MNHFYIKKWGLASHYWSLCCIDEQQCISCHWVDILLPKSGYKMIVYNILYFLFVEYLAIKYNKEDFRNIITFIIFDSRLIKM